jgi:hypothetical protein
MYVINSFLRMKSRGAKTYHGRFASTEIKGGDANNRTNKTRQHGNKLVQDRKTNTALKIAEKRSYDLAKGVEDRNTRTSILKVLLAKLLGDVLKRGRDGCKAGAMASEEGGIEGEEEGAGIAREGGRLESEGALQVCSGKSRCGRRKRHRHGSSDTGNSAQKRRETQEENREEGKM